MWKRKLGCAWLLLLFWVRQPLALPLDWQQLGTNDLLQEAALAIQHLKTLNEALTKQAAESEKQSKELAAQLETLTSENEKLLQDIANLQKMLGTLQEDWITSEQIRKELENTLTNLQASLKSCREEAKKNIRRAGIAGLAVGVGFAILLSLTMRPILTSR